MRTEAAGQAQQMHGDRRGSHDAASNSGSPASSPFASTTREAGEGGASARQPSAASLQRRVASCEPDEITYGLMIESADRARDWRRALALYEVTGLPAARAFPGRPTCCSFALAPTDIPPCRRVAIGDGRQGPAAERQHLPPAPGGLRARRAVAVRRQDLWTDAIPGGYQGSQGNVCTAAHLCLPDGHWGAAGANPAGSRGHDRVRWESDLRVALPRQESTGSANSPPR